MADNQKTISELTELPGNLSPTALLAIVQNGVTYHATGEQVSNMVLGNISVVENTNGVSIRVPTINLQICWHAFDLQSVQAPYIEGGWVFPEPFGAAPEVVGIVQVTGSSVAPGSAELGSVTRTNRGSSGVNLRVHRIGSTSFVNGNNLIVNAVAFGRY